MPFSGLWSPRPNARYGTGRVLGRLRLSEGVLIPPLIAISTLYILDDDGDLAAYR